MTMDKTAIEQIQKVAHLPEIIDHLVNTETHIPVAPLPSGVSIESLEAYMENASRFRMKYKTTSISDFVRYCIKHDTPGATCFVDAQDMDAVAIIDLGTTEVPGHKSNKAVLSLHKTAAYHSLLKVNSGKLRQKTASEFIEDWADDIIAYTQEGDTMTPMQAARSLQDLTIEAAREVNSKVSDFGASMSAMEKIEAKNQSMLPAEIRFTCVPYHGLKERTFKLRVGIITSEEKPMVSLRLTQLEAVEECIAEEFKDEIIKRTELLEMETYIGIAS